MKVNINVKRTFKINGKEYNSVDEIPPDLRETLKQSANSIFTSESSSNPSAIHTTINFNGTVYESIHTMPKGVRLLYESALKAAHVDNGRQSSPSESFFSLKKLIAAAVIIAALLMLYYLFHAK
ncbi:MAG: hypothetical protein ACM3SY_21590 [Candidatus Omnitrophota bacterium]